MERRVLWELKITDVHAVAAIAAFIGVIIAGIYWGPWIIVGWAALVVVAYFVADIVSQIVGSEPRWFRITWR